MRFFEQQRQARTQTVRLLLLFAFTLLVLVVAVNAALALTWRLVAWQDATYPDYFFHINTGVTLLFVLGGWWIESSNLAGGGQHMARRVGARPAKVLGPLTLGDGCTVGANAVVLIDVPPNSLAVGIPARIVLRTTEIDHAA